MVSQGQATNEAVPKQVIKTKFVNSLNNKIILVMQNVQTEFPQVLSHHYLPLGISSVCIASENDNINTFTNNFSLSIRL